MKHESLKLKDIRNVVKGLFIHLYNALHLLVQSCDELNIDKKGLFFINDEKCLYSSISSNINLMDTWIAYYT
ncbi:unnamed protein product [Rotaria sp. Silwood1]|nr:unnamed protein product [Rotaria sp. Silwood1]